MGLQKQVLTNALQIAWGVFRGVGAVLVLWLFSPTIFAFALWQLISNAIYCFFARLSLWRALSISPAQSQPQFKWQVFRNTWRYAAGMAGMAVVSTLLTQTDKLVVSKMLSLEMLGYYTLAGSLATVPLMLASPIASVIKVRPGPEVAVIAGEPANDAPITMLIDAISSSACTTTPPNLGSSAAKNSIKSVAGVIGYPAKKRQPDAMAPSASAWLPVITNVSGVSPVGGIR